MLERIEKYRILEEIGQGGMSVVYRAHDEALDRYVAIKVLHKHLARDPAARERFSREARAVARLTHPNIPEIHDFSSKDDSLNYLVTELVEGASLADLVREAPPMLPEVGVMVTLGVCRALAHAHDHQVIHRDVKPENILVGRDGVVKLTDFGIAQIVGLESMTITGTLVGSPAHMSPEQVEGRRDLDLRADVWAMGTVLYVTCTGGTLPFDAPHPHGVLRKIVVGKYEDARRLNPHIHSPLAAIIDRCLRKDRADRYSSMTELGDDIEAWLKAREITAPVQELRAWMADPAGYQKDLGQRLIPVLMGVGDRVQRAGDRHQALEAFGRVLTLDPDHAEALSRVKSLHSHLRTRRMARHGLLTALALAAVGAIVSMWPEPEPPPTTPALVISEPAPSLLTPPPAPRDLVERSRFAPVLGRGTGAGLGELQRRARRLTAVTRRRPPSRDVSARLVPVKFTVEPPAVQMTIAGKRIATGKVLQFPVGRHRATLTHPGCAACPAHRAMVDVPATVTGGPHREHLRFRYPPTRVTITCDGGTVAVDGKLYGPCGATYDVPVYSHTPKLGKLVVKFPSGASKSSRIQIEPSGRVQRVVAR